MLKNREISVDFSSSTSIDDLKFVTKILGEQNEESIWSFVEENLDSLIAIKQSSWRILSESFDVWRNCEVYETFVRVLDDFDLKLIPKADQLDEEKRLQLFLPAEKVFLEKILEKIVSNDEKFIEIASKSIDRLSYFVHEFPTSSLSPILIFLNNKIGEIFLNENSKTFLRKISTKNVSTETLTVKLCFYLRTCSFSLFAFLCSKPKDFPFSGDKIVRFLHEDFKKFVQIRSENLENLNEPLLSCFSRLVALFCAASWWSDHKSEINEIIFPLKDSQHEFLQSFIKIVSFTPFLNNLSTGYSNDRTILIDTSLLLLYSVIETQDLGCFINTETKFASTLIQIAQIQSYERIRFCAYGLLAMILNEEQLKQLKVGENIVQLYFLIFEKAWKEPTRVWKKIPITYLLKGIKSLSSNASLQNFTAQSKKIDIFIEVCDQYPMVLDIIWALSFNSSICEQLRSNEKFSNKLDVFEKEIQDESIRTMIRGIRWNLFGHNQMKRSKVIKYDLMISYCHKDKAVCQRLYEDLIKMNYQVWIDFAQMHGNMMDAMADAIEQSAAVVVCMSEPYRRSNFCRAEAEFAFQRQLKILPILVQKYYKADGWLAFVLGTSLYVDFTKYDYPKAFEMLVEEIKLSKLNSDKEISKKIRRNSNESDRSPEMPENIDLWTEIHVHQWLKENQLDQMAELLRDVDGPSLIQFSQFLVDADSQQILSSLQKDCQTKLNEDLSLVELARFQSLIKKRRNSSRSKSEKASKFCTIF